MLKPGNTLQQYVQAGFVSAILLANLPQLLLSVVYMAFNRVLTTLLLSKEANQFSIRRKGLRVSSAPQGDQRSEYFLGLPYRYALPFMFFSAILHWLCSQSFFFISIFREPVMLGNNRNSNSYDPDEFLTLGYSPQAILFLALLVILIYAMLLYLGMARFKTRMPLSGSCSAVISAMCHQHATEDGDEAVLKPLMWGVSCEGVRHGAHVVECSFTSRGTRQPEDYEAVLTWGYKN
jgi:hypothetical protein